MEKKRSIILDTETTGINPAKGDRIIEIAALELINSIPTGKTYHVLINPQRDIPQEAVRVHGITENDVKDKPIFADIMPSFFEFVKNDNIIAHNAPFDFSFLNAEIKKAGGKVLSYERMVDTLVMARNKFSGASNSLDALCRRFNIDLSARTKHNALLDCQLLAKVYDHLIGGRQRHFSLEEENYQGPVYEMPKQRKAIHIKPSKEQLQLHASLVEKIPNALWSH